MFSSQFAHQVVIDGIAIAKTTEVVGPVVTRTYYKVEPRAFLSLELLGAGEPQKIGYQATVELVTQALDAKVIDATADTSGSIFGLAADTDIDYESNLRATCNHHYEAVAVVLAVSS